MGKHLNEELLEFLYYVKNNESMFSSANPLLVMSVLTALDENPSVGCDTKELWEWARDLFKQR